MEKVILRKMVKKDRYLIFITNNLLILSFGLLKLVDFITTFQQLEYGNIFEANLFAVNLVQNPLLMYFLLFLYVSFLFIINFLTYYNYGYNEIQKLLLFIIVISNLIGIVVLWYNYNIYINTFRGI